MPPWTCRRQTDAPVLARLELTHGVYRVVDQVEQHLLQLVPVAQDDDGLRAQVRLQLDAVELELVDDEQRGAGGDLVQVHGGLLRHALPREGQEVADDASGSLRLVVDHPQVLVRKVGMGRPLQQQLGEAGDRGEGVVELVRHAGDELADGRHLVVLDELGLEDPLLGDVLDEDDDGAGVGGPPGLLGERRGREPEDPLGLLQPHHQGRGALPTVGVADQLFHRVGRVEEGLAESLADQILLVDLRQRGQRAVGTEHRAVRPHHRDAFGQRIERRLPLLLALAHDLVEPAVREHHRRVGGDGGEEPQVLGREGTALAIGHRERPHGDALRAERRDRRRAHRHPRDQGHRRRADALRHLDPLAADREAYQSGVRLVRPAPLNTLQRARGGDHPEKLPLVIVGQDDDRAVRLEKAAGVARHLVYDAVELDRFGEDVAQLLKGEELADSAVELAREGVRLALGLARAAAAAGDRHPEAGGDGRDRDEREPPDAVIRQPDDHAQKAHAHGVERVPPTRGATRQAAR